MLLMCYASSYLSIIPLVTDHMMQGRVLEDLWDDERRKERLHWTMLFSQLIAQWMQWLGMQNSPSCSNKTDSYVCVYFE